MTEHGQDPNKLRFSNVNFLNLKNEVETLDKPDIVDMSTVTKSKKNKLES